MGVVVKQKVRGKGKPWWVFIHHEGRRITRSVGGREEAERIAAEIRRRLATGSLGFDGTETDETPFFADYAARYLDKYARVACKHSTWRGYQTIFDRHLVPQWGSKRLSEITRADVRTLLLAKQADLAPATVENIKALISGLFTHAVEEEIIDSNPALRLGRIIKKHDRRAHVRPLTTEEASRFLSAARGHAPDHYPLLLCAFRTGMRLGELLGLAWQDIDFAGNVIEVRRGYSHGRFSTPKSHKSRMVDMSDQLGETLRARRDQLRLLHRGEQPAVMVKGARKREAAIQMAFPDRTGGPQDGDNFRSRVFYRLIELAGVPRFRFHDIRHTFASLLLQNGEPLHYVKEQLGHASIQTTVDTYGHLVPGSNRAAVNRLDDIHEFKLLGGVSQGG